MGPSGCGKTTLLNCLSGLDAVDAGDVLDRGHVARRHVRQGAHRLPGAAHGLRLPVLQPDARAERGRERRAAAPDRARRPQREARERALEALGARRPGRPGRPPPGRALGRRAPARHDRAGARQRPGDRLGRRADRRPRQRERGRDRRPDAAAQRGARADVPARHARHRRSAEKADRIVRMLDGQVAEDNRVEVPRVLARDAA